MNKLDTEYLDKYKKLDEMLAKRFELKYGGVSEYIKRMEQMPEKKAAQIAGWKADYKKLKHLRWVRNQIAHSTESACADKTDYADLGEMANRFAKKTDPLSAAERLKKPVGKIIAAALVVLAAAAFLVWKFLL